MSTSVTAPTQLRVRTTHLPWRQPHFAKPAPAPIDPAYEAKATGAAPASALVAALASTATLFLGFGLLAIPAAAFA